MPNMDIKDLFNTYVLLKNNIAGLNGESALIYTDILTKLEVILKEHEEKQKAAEEKKEEKETKKKK